MRPTVSLIAKCLSAAAALLSGALPALAQSAGAPWRMTGLGHEIRRITVIEENLRERLRYGYAVCNADHQKSMVLYYSLNQITNRVLGPRQCYGIDGMFRLEVHSETHEASDIAGVYQVYRWGSFGRSIDKGVAFPLSDDGIMRPPGGARVHALQDQRNVEVACRALKPEEGASKDYALVCPVDLKRIANWRFCFPHNALGTAEVPPGSLSLFTSSDEVLRQGVPPLMRSIIPPGTCVDIHEQSRVWMLVAKSKSEKFAPESVKAIRLNVATIPK